MASSVLTMTWSCCGALSKFWMAPPRRIRDHAASTLILSRPARHRGHGGYAMLKCAPTLHRYLIPLDLFVVLLPGSPEPRPAAWGTLYAQRGGRSLKQRGPVRTGLVLAG